MAVREIYNDSFGALGVEVAKKFPEWRRVLERREKPKQRDTLGIALSGGGYRSAIFCYGVLRGLHELGVLSHADYLSVVSGGSWIGMAYATTEYLDRWFFDRPPGKPNYLEEGFESFLANPVRLAEELALTRATRNYVSDVFGRLVAGTFLREHGQNARFAPLSGPGSLVKDGDRPFLIVNGTLNYRPAEQFTVQQECFEMTRLVSGSRSLGYVDSRQVMSIDKPLRVRDAVAISGAAVAVHLPGVGDEVHGIGLSREIANYARGAHANAPTDDALDVADGGHYNNLGVESLVNRGCGYLIVVDAEHDPERPAGGRSNQQYSGLRKLLRRNHIRTAFGGDAEAAIARIDAENVVVQEFTGDASVPDVLYVKLKSWAKFDAHAKSEAYNKAGFLKRLVGGKDFHFDPQFSTAKLDYELAEHRNLSGLGNFVVTEHADQIRKFAKRAR